MVPYFEEKHKNEKMDFSIVHYFEEKNKIINNSASYLRNTIHKFYIFT